MGVILYYLLIFANLSFAVNFAIVIWLILIGFYFCESAGKHFGKADHSAIVWDEISAMLLVLICLPPLTQNFIGVILGFLAFRFFDIFKPPPAKQIDKYWHHGFGVMLDDIVAAIYAIIVIWLLYYFKIIS